MRITSQELQQAQNVLQELAKNEIDDPMTDYSKLANLMTVINDVDSLRREAWNEEMFGASEAMADEAISAFDSDDNIPF